MTIEHRHSENRDDERKDAPGFLLDGVRVPVARRAPGLHVVATPIGNLEDITLRALATLAAADAILAEDTRHTGRLLHHYGIRNRLMPYHEHNAARMRPRIMRMLSENASLALVSDAGTPLISDPGLKLVRDAIAAGHAVHAVPGPTAAIAALTVSGLPTDRFFFAGFPPAKTAARRRWLAELRTIPATLIFYESPARIADSLADMAEILGPRPAALCRELTKLHEEVLRLPLDLLAEDMRRRERVRGEIAIVIAPPSGERAAKHADDETAREDLEAALRAALENAPPARAAKEIARRFRRPRKEIYALALALREKKDEG